MTSRNTLSRVLFLALAIVVLVHATGSAMWFAGPVLLLALLGMQIKSSDSAEITYASLAIGEGLVIIIGLSSMPLALIVQALVLMSAGLHLSPATRGAIASDALVSGTIGITAGIVVFVLYDVYLILFAIFCAILSILVVVRFNERRIMGISERNHA